MCELGVCNREMDIAKRYEKSYHHSMNIQKMNWIEQTLTLAQLRDFKNVIKPRYVVKVVDNRLIKMTELANEGVECGWSFYPIHKIKRYEHYPRTHMNNTEALWKKHLMLPEIINKR